MQFKLLLLVLALSTSLASAQNTFETIATYTANRQYPDITAWYESTPPATIHFTGDSLTWLQFRVSRAYLNQGNIAKADSIATQLMRSSNAIQSEDLKLRLHLYYALLLKQQNKYNRAITEFIALQDIIKQQITALKIEENSVELAQAYEKLTTAYINRANSHYYLGQIEEYGYYTQLAVQTSASAANTRQNLIARRNLIEYYEIIEDWDQVVTLLGEYSNKLAELTAAEPENSINTQKEQARYQLRQGIYVKSKQKNYKLARQLITSALHISDSLHAFQVYTSALYELVNTEILTHNFDEAHRLLTYHQHNPMVLENPNAAVTIKARLLQLYIITGQRAEAQACYRSLQIMNRAQISSTTEAIVSHTFVMYLTGEKEEYTARLILQQLIATATANNTTADNASTNIDSYLFALYQQYKYSITPALTDAEIITKMLEQYKKNELNEWIYRSQQPPHSKLLIIMGSILACGLLLILLYYKIPQHPAAVGSLGYQDLSARINSI